MHDDLIDAVHRAVDEGYADPARVRSSAATTAVTPRWSAWRSPPTSSPQRSITWGSRAWPTSCAHCPPSPSRTWPTNNWHLFVGNPDVPEQEADMLARSPIIRVDQIRTPLLVVQGANDDSRVMQAESDNLVEALRARGVEVEYMVKDDEGRGFVNDENVIDLYRAIERFLAEHIGGRRA
jgi:hypothetical protein